MARNERGQFVKGSLPTNGFKLGHTSFMGMLGKIHTDETKNKMRLSAKKGENSHRWKDNPTYQGVHAWIRRVMGKPNYCEKCEFTSENSRQFHWANVSREYKRDIWDWQRLCGSCHSKYDDILKKSWETKKQLLASTALLRA